MPKNEDQNKMPTKKRFLAIAGGLALISGVMGFFGIPGLFPSLVNLTAIELSDVQYCDTGIDTSCKDILIDEPPNHWLIKADRLTFSENVTLLPNTVILANEIDLGGNTIIGKERLIVYAREARNGTISVTLNVDPSQNKESIHGIDGTSGGELIGSIAKFPSSLTLDLTGRPGSDGRRGKNGKNGKNGECGAFSYEGNRPGGNGKAGGNAGSGGDGGSINLWFAIGPVTGQQIPVTGGSPGNPGAGGQGGKGGDGCTGLGGTQERDSDGLEGANGMKGTAGTDGKNNLVERNLSQLYKFSSNINESPKEDFESYRRLAQYLK